MKGNYYAEVLGKLEKTIPYSPDLAPCDYFLFRKLKKKFRGQRFSDDKELIWEVEHFFAEQEETFFLTIYFL
jgi:hypothetical protein